MHCCTYPAQQHFIEAGIYLDVLKHYSSITIVVLIVHRDLFQMWSILYQVHVLRSGLILWCGCLLTFDNDVVSLGTTVLSCGLWRQYNATDCCSTVDEHGHQPIVVCSITVNSVCRFLHVFEWETTLPSSVRSPREPHQSITATRPRIILVLVVSY